MSLPLLAVFGSIALAEEPVFQEAKGEDKTYEAPETDLSVEVGGAFSIGNAVYYTVNGKASAAHRWRRNELQATLLANYGAAKADTDGDGLLSDAERAADLTPNAKHIGGEARYDRYVSKVDSLYLLVGGLTDTFAGYDLRTHEQLGYAHKFSVGDSSELDAEVGFDVAQENYVDGVDPASANIFAARVQVHASHTFGESFALSDTVEAYENVLDTKDFRLLNSAELTAKLSDVFSLKVSNTLTFDNVPVEGFQSLDDVTLVTLVASLM